MNRYINEAGQHYWPDIEEAAKTNIPKILHVCKRMIADLEPSFYSEMESKFDKTFYNILKELPACTVFAVITGDISVEEFKIWLSSKDKSTDFKNIGPDRYTDFQWPAKVVKAMETLAKAGKSNYKETPEEAATSGGVSQEAFDELKDTLKELTTKHEGFVKFFEETETNYKEKLKELSSSKVKEELEGLTIGEGDLTSTVTMRPAKELFFGVTDNNIEVPVFEWKDAGGNVVAHPDTPKQDPKYLFREKELARVLYALMTNQRMYLHGHTGTGKTTLIEQVAAHLNWPVLRINFDSEITRMDLIGKTDLVADGGTTTTQWQDGLLPKAMSNAYIAIFDEIDFCRPDVSYVMQAATEGNGMTLLEDGGRKVYPHQMFRMFATGNTVGQGDEFGMYQGARAQSLAFLDRFTIWQKVDYLPEDKRKELAQSAAPTLKSEIVDRISKYVTEHLEAFTGNSVLQPISPRGMMAVAKAAEFLSLNGASDEDALSEALDMVVLDRCTQEDRAVLQGIKDRVWK
jgi:cobaltochelatase CobS subunit